jgi:hypothetical protein
MQKREIKLWTLPVLGVGLGVVTMLVAVLISALSGWAGADGQENSGQGGPPAAHDGPTVRPQATPTPGVSRVVVLLAAPSGVELIETGENMDSNTAIRAVEQSQKPVIAAAAALGARHMGGVQYVMNALFFELPSANVAALWGVAGVKSVSPAELFMRDNGRMPGLALPKEFAAPRDPNTADK